LPLAEFRARHLAREQDLRQVLQLHIAIFDALDKLGITTLAEMLDAFDEHGPTKLAEIAAALGMAPAAATALFNCRWWHEGDVARLQKAAARLGL